MFEFLTALFAILFTIYAVKWHTRKPIRPKIVSDWRERFPLQEVETYIPNCRAFEITDPWYPKIGDRVSIRDFDKVETVSSKFAAELHTLAAMKRLGTPINYIGTVLEPRINGLIRVKFPFHGRTEYIDAAPEALTFVGRHP